MTKISALPELTVPANEDVLLVVDSPSATPLLKKTTLGGIRQEVLLYDVSISSGSGLFDASPLDQGYDDLIILLEGRTDGTGAADNITIYFNGDEVITDYHYTRHFAHDTTHTISNAANSILPRLPGSPGPTDEAGILRIDIPSYTGSNLKMAIGNSAAYTGTDQIVRDWGMVSWEDGASETAITHIHLRPDGYAGASDTFVPPSRCRILGVTYK